MSGPTVLFDKSFIQSLSVDESLWFDHFSIAIISPLFYIETLADLEKKVREGRTVEDEVGIIANKAPMLGGQPNVHYKTICYSELHGQKTPLNGRVPIAGGHPVADGKDFSVMVPESPEANALSRWQNREFLELERGQAKRWREMLSEIDLVPVAELAKQLGVSNKERNSAFDAKRIVEQAFSEDGSCFDQLKFIFELLNVHPREVQELIKRWQISGQPSVSRHAPYCTYVATVELFFQLVVGTDLISTTRASNRIDVGYLHYLPFCMYFVSSDRLHRRCSPPFLRSNQSFVWGPDLKAALSEINSYYKKFPEDEKNLGIHAFARHPPIELEGNLVLELWDRHIPKWRNTISSDGAVLKQNPDLLRHVTKIAEAPELTGKLRFDSDDASAMVLKRMVPTTRGSWQVIDKKIKE